MSDPVEAEVVEERSLAALHPAVVEHQGALVRPAAALDEIEAAFNAYQDLQGRILEKSDFQRISGKDFPKKSAWRKLSVAFGVSFEQRSKDYERDANGRIVRAEYTIRAIAPNGRFADGTGACDLFEKCCQPNCNKGGQHRHCAARNGTCTGSTHFSNSQHDVPATAETRAKNRAASDLFGLGQVSAEEVVDHGDTTAAPVSTTHEGVPICVACGESTAGSAVKRNDQRAWVHRTCPAGSRDPAPQATSGGGGGEGADAAALPSCRLCDHEEALHGSTPPRGCTHCDVCPGYEAELPSDQNRELFDKPAPDPKTQVKKAREQLKEAG